jgi:hypothetical protein
MSTVTKQDLQALLMILYQGSFQKKNLAKIPVTINTSYGSKRLPQTTYFTEADIALVALELGYPLPTAPLGSVLSVGLAQGLYLRSIENGTQCGANPCHPNQEQLPTLIYGYNPFMLNNPANRLILQ